MSKEELIAKAKAGRVDFKGDVAIDGNWNGVTYDCYFAHYADKDGIHACMEGNEEYIDDFPPFKFDEIDNDVYKLLCDNIV